VVGLDESNSGPVPPIPHWEARPGRSHVRVPDSPAARTRWGVRHRLPLGSPASVMSQFELEYTRSGGCAAANSIGAILLSFEVPAPRVSQTILANSFSQRGFWRESRMQANFIRDFRWILKNGCAWSVHLPGFRRKILPFAPLEICFSVARWSTRINDPQRRPAPVAPARAPAG
jgi:hypothetical protein